MMINITEVKAQMVSLLVSSVRVLRMGESPNKKRKKRKIHCNR